MRFRKINPIPLPRPRIKNTAMIMVVLGATFLETRGISSTEKEGNTRALVMDDSSFLFSNMLYILWFTCTSMVRDHRRSEAHTSELQSLMRISYAVFCLKNNSSTTNIRQHNQRNN